MKCPCRCNILSVKYLSVECPCWRDVPVGERIGRVVSRISRDARIENIHNVAMQTKTIKSLPLSLSFSMKYTFLSLPHKCPRP